MSTQRDDGGPETLRDKFAMAALTGMLANHSAVDMATFAHVNMVRGHQTIGETYAGAAFEYADLMLAARATSSPTGGTENG